MIDHVVIPKNHLIQRLPFPREVYRVRNVVSKTGGNMPEAYFNPSIVRYGQALWMSYRVEADPFIFPQAAVVRLNNRFEPQYTTNKILSLNTRWAGQNAEDIRLFEHGPELWGAYNDGGRIWLARFDAEVNNEFSLQAEVDFRQLVIEKNWCFFSYNGTIYCVYLCAPDHVVLEMEWVGTQPVLCRKHVTSWNPKWEFGEIRGGAPAILHNGLFYHFFHSWTEDPVFDRRYHAGVYVFESKPPFAPVGISTKPVFSAPYHAVPMHRKFAVVFPCGAVRVDGGWKVSYGLHDWECCIATIPDEDIVIDPI